MMKRIILFVLISVGFSLLHTAVVAQIVQKTEGEVKTPKNRKTKAKTKAKTPAVEKPVSTTFTIDGTVTGFPEGTLVEFLNSQTGAPEMSTAINNGKFSFTGKMEHPDFKIILFNKQPPFITLFMDNSDIVITGDKLTIDKSTVTGSASHAAFDKFNTMLAPYQSVFTEGLATDAETNKKAMDLIREFVAAHKGAYITPLAIIRFNQVADEISETEELYNQLDAPVKASAMGQYIARLIAEEKQNGTGTVLADFTQPDTSGVPVSLSSLRGNYVLVDFWASWCGPCRQENPNLVAAYNKYKNKNFTVLGVSLDKAKQAWIDAIKIDGLTWTHMSDLQGWQNAVAQQFQIYSIPQNFLLDPDGKVIGKNLRGPALEKKLAKVLK